MKRILGIGNALTDISVVLHDNALPCEFGFEAGSMNHVGWATCCRIEERLALHHVKMEPAGSAANTVGVTAALGMESGFIGKVGCDAMGDAYGEILERRGVRAHLLRGAGNSGRTIVMIPNRDEERVFVACLGAALELGEDDLDPAIFRNYDYLHLEGYLMQCGNVARRAVEIAKSMGMIVSFDLGNCNMVKKYCGAMRNIIADYADIVFANMEEARAFTGKEPVEAVAEMASMGKGRCAVVKLSGDGSLVQNGNKMYEIPAAPADVVDTTGAGDVYAAGFLYAHSIGKTPRECGCLGACLASKAVEQIGVPYNISLKNCPV